MAQLTPGGIIVGTPGVISTTPVTPFFVTGYIEDFKLLPPPAGTPVQLQGATITVNGKQIIIPANTIVEFPASQLTPYDISTWRRQQAGGQLGERRIGPGLNDIGRPLAAFEATLIATSSTGNTSPV